MAKRKKRKSLRSPVRDISKITRRNRLNRTLDKPLAEPVNRELNSLLDSRQFTPDPDIPRNYNGTPATVVSNAPIEYGTNKKETRHYLRFASPHRVVICNRRRERREVLFSKKKAGKGKRITGQRYHTLNSDIVCRRKK